MKKSIALFVALALSLTLFAGCGSSKPAPSATAAPAENAASSGSDAPAASAGGKILNIYTWAEMFDQDVLDGFEKETGIKINYTNFDYDETMLSKLEASKGGVSRFLSRTHYNIFILQIPFKD